MSDIQTFVTMNLLGHIPKVNIVKIHHYFCIGAHSQCTEQGCLVQVNVETTEKREMVAPPGQLIAL